MAAGFEIEVKSLLGSAEKAAALRTRLLASVPGMKLASQNRQLNHYFARGDVAKLREKLGILIPADHEEDFKNIIEHGKNHSIRTRQMDESVILVLKSSIDDTTSSNGIMRMEFEVTFPDLTLEALDKLLLDAGFQYQAKWSREREQYEAPGLTVCLDKNAGYGYLAEFERVVATASEAEKAREELREEMQKLGVEELSQERLERMFAHYNAHWEEYYGTEKVFTIE